MKRINPIALENATGKAHDLLTAVHKQFGSVPNIFQTMAQSPTVLDAYLNFNALLKQGALTSKLTEQIAVAVAGKNHCDYCASAHTALGGHAGIDKPELEKNLRGSSEDIKTHAALTFCLQVIDSRGMISDEYISVVREAGYSDGEIIEMIAHIGINTFSNYFNAVAKTEIDFPVIRS